MTVSWRRSARSSWGFDDVGAVAGADRNDRVVAKDRLVLTEAQSAHPAADVHSVLPAHVALARLPFATAGRQALARRSAFVAVEPNEHLQGVAHPLGRNQVRRDGGIG
jgi:hypothetical protein